jgi:hypothetical protein
MVGALLECDHRSIFEGVGIHATLNSVLDHLCKGLGDHIVIWVIWVVCHAALPLQVCNQLPRLTALHTSSCPLDHIQYARGGREILRDNIALHVSSHAGSSRNTCVPSPHDTR